MFDVMFYPISISIDDILEESRYQEVFKDDFEDFFDMTAIKICLTITLLSEFFISNFLSVLFIMFDKYGEDSLKRSLFNQVIVQVSYSVIISSLISTPCWILRLAFGPLSSIMAIATAFIGKTSNQYSQCKCLRCHYAPIW